MVSETQTNIFWERDAVAGVNPAADIPLAGGGTLQTRFEIDGNMDGANDWNGIFATPEVLGVGVQLEDREAGGRGGCAGERGLPDALGADQPGDPGSGRGSAGEGSKIRELHPPPRDHLSSPLCGLSATISPASDGDDPTSKDTY